jgi:hypothetical protein
VTDSQYRESRVALWPIGGLEALSGCPIYGKGKRRVTHINLFAKVF